MQVRPVRIHTDDVAPRDRLEVWRQRVSRALYPMRAYPLDDAQTPFHADYRGVRGQHSLAAMGSVAPTRSEVTPSDIASADPDRLQIFVPLSGGGVHSDRNGSVEVAPGMLFVTSADRPRTYLRPEVSTSAMIEVDARVLSLSRDQLRECSFRALSAPPAMLRLLRDSIRNLVASDSTDAAATDTLLAATTDLALRSSVGLELDQNANNAGRLEQVRQYLAAHLADGTLNSDTIAAALAISRRTLFNLFAESDLTPMALLGELRVEQAKTLLASGDRTTLDEVAAHCGFSGADQLYRVFRKVAGESPTEFRARGIVQTSP